jgi:hypothetical protein
MTMARPALGEAAGAINGALGALGIDKRTGQESAPNRFPMGS